MRNPFPTTLAVIAGLALAWRGILAYVFPPIGYDALSYHLPTLAHWLREGQLSESPLNICCAGYPAAGELFFAWPAILIGNDTWVDAVQVGFAVYAAIAVAGIARIASVSRPNALVAGSLFALTPIVLTQANTTDVDLILVAGFLATTFFVLRFLEPPVFGLRRHASTGPRSELRFELLILAGIAAGIALGTKLTGVVPLLIFAATILTGGLVAAARGRLRAWTAVAACGAFVLTALAVGGFWYAKDVVDHGNPVYPLGVRVAGLAVLEGPKDLDDVITTTAPEIRDDPELIRIVHSWARDILFWKNSTYSYGQRLGGLGPVWSYLGTWLVLVFAFMAWRRDRLILFGFLVPVAGSTRTPSLRPGFLGSRLRSPQPAQSQSPTPWIGIPAARSAWPFERECSPWRSQVPELRLWIPTPGWRGGITTPRGGASGRPRTRRAIDRRPVPARISMARRAGRRHYGRGRPRDCPPHFAACGRTLRSAGRSRAARRPQIGRFVAEHDLEYLVVRSGSKADRWATRQPLRLVAQQDEIRVYRIRTD